MEHSDQAGQYTVSQRVMELVVAGLLMGVACLVMYDNWRIGAGWADDGPQAGLFPFAMGAILFIASLTTFMTNLLTKTPDLKTFVERQQAILVLKVLLPTIVLVIAINFLGIYVAGALFIAFFMAWLGKYPIYKIVPVAVGVPLVLFMMFEVWFLVPLPKGPLEAALGY
jgi:putative tricarboxylic transport membrane protein